MTRSGRFRGRPICPQCGHGELRLVEETPDPLYGALGVWWAFLSGLVAGVVIGFSTEYFTSNVRRPARNVAAAAQTGSSGMAFLKLGVGGRALGMAMYVPAKEILGYSRQRLLNYVCTAMAGRIGDGGHGAR